MHAPRVNGRFNPVLGAVFAVLWLISTGVHGQGEDNGAPPPTPSTLGTGSELPPVEQALVPEGVFAAELAQALKLGPVADDAKAEELLSTLGIEPEHGWIAEYPVTPAVLGDIEKDVAAASAARTLALTQEQALKAVEQLKSRLGFTVKPGPDIPDNLIKKQGSTTLYRYTDAKGVTHFTDVYDSIPEGYRKNAKKIRAPKPPKPVDQTGANAAESLAPEYIAKPNTESIDAHYDDSGPPMVTYYAPPDPYAYLYVWVPYPFWSTGFYFPGYFVLNNFRRQVFFHRHPYFVSHHARNPGFDQHPRGVPANPAESGPASGDGKTPSRGYSTAPAQAGAKAIFALKQNQRRPPRQGGAAPRKGVPEHAFAAGGQGMAQGTVPAWQNRRRGERYPDTARPLPNMNDRVFNRQAGARRIDESRAPRFSSAPAFNPDRVLRPRPSFGHAVSGGFHRGGDFQGGGGSSGRGGSLRGGSSGGRR